MAYRAAGDGLFTVSKVLGHASITTTASFYGHTDDAMLQASADRMEAVMRRATGT